MCHHYRSAKAVPEHFVAEFSIRTYQRSLFEKLAGEMPDLGAWPLKTVPALRLNESGGLDAFPAEWGLLPRWWKPSDKTTKRTAFQRKTFNARAETASEKPTFRDAFKRRRCLLPVEEFFEREHYFGVGEPISFAGLWESWTGEQGEIASVTLLTTEPNAEVRAVGHNRMPVLLVSPNDRRRWLLHEDCGADLQPLADGVLSVRGAGE